MRAWIAAILLTSACTQQAAPTCQSSPMPKPVVLLLPNEPATVRLGLQSRCFDAFQGGQVADPSPATGVTVEVLDPDNRAVPFTATTVTNLTPAPGAPVDTFCDIAFTATADGLYSVSAQFEPGKGRVQHVFSAVRIRADAGVRVLATDLPVDCTQYALLGDDLVCVHPSPTGTELAVGTQRFAGERFLVGDDALWLSNSTSSGFAFDRLARDGGRYDPTHHVPTNQTPLEFAAGGDGTLWVMGTSKGSTSIQRVMPLANGTVAPLIEHGAQAPPQTLAGATDRLLAVTRVPAQVSDVISFQKDGGFAASQTSRPVELSWSDGEQLWMSMADPSSGAVLRTELQCVDAPAGVTRTNRMLGVGKLPRPGLLSPACPVMPDGISPGRPLVALNDPQNGVRFETFDPGPDYFPVASANARHAFARSKDGKTVKVFDR